MNEGENTLNQLKTRPIPAIIMLLAGLAAAITTYVNRYPVKDALLIILVSMIVFLIIGNIVKMILDRFEMPDENAVDEDGEMVEKAPEGGAVTEDNENTENEEADE